MLSFAIGNQLCDPVIFSILESRHHPSTSHVCVGDTGAGGTGATGSAADCEGMTFSSMHVIAVAISM